jgi:hypothetical protein
MTKRATAVSMKLSMITKSLWKISEKTYPDGKFVLIVEYHQHQVQVPTLQHRYQLMVGMIADTNNSTYVKEKIYRV